MIGKKLASVEHYTLHHGPQGTVVRFSQFAGASIGTVVFGGMLGLGAFLWRIGETDRPSSIFLWIWMVGSGVACLASIVVSLREKRFILKGSELVYEATLDRGRRISVGTPPKLLVEAMGPPNDEGFNYGVHFLDGAGNTTGLVLAFQFSENVDRLLTKLRQVISVDIEDLRRKNIPS